MECPSAGCRLALTGIAVVAMAAFLTGCSKPDAPAEAAPASREDRFIQVMNTGKNYYDQGQAEKAVAAFQEAAGIYPARTDARLNLANALLLANEAEAALTNALEVLEYDRNSAAAYYVAGCAHFRLRQPDEAVKMFLPARDLDRDVAAVSFLLGRAYQEMGSPEDAIAAFREAVARDPEHPAAHYALAQLLIRSGQAEEGTREMEIHQGLPQKPGGGAGPEVFERCRHTEARAPAKVIRPDRTGVPVTFADVTDDVLTNAAVYHAPIAVLDYNRDGRNSVFAPEGADGFRLLDNRDGRFAPLGQPLPFRETKEYHQALVGDFNNDRFEDVLVTGPEGSQMFRFATNGMARDFTTASGLKGLQLRTRQARILDIDFTGKLDILGILPDGDGIRVLRNLGNMYFKDITVTSGVPAVVQGVTALAVDDWNNDDLLDVFAARSDGPVLYFEKVRGGALQETDLPTGPVTGTVIALGDLNGDARTDLLAGGGDQTALLLGGIHQRVELPATVPELSRLTLLDYDNDGWLDVLASGRGLQVWRNLGDGAFTNLTRSVGLDRWTGRVIDDLAVADLDCDGDSDLVLAVAGAGLKILRNDGGNANRMIKLRLLGNRSNATGLGIRIEASMGSFKVHRTVDRLPVEIGIGGHDRVDAIVARWFDLPSSIVDVEPEPCEALNVFEPVIPAGSCPYLYAWDGRGFRFVSDILGSAPMGLRITDTAFIEADPREYIALGGAADFPPRDGEYVVQITEELREVLYLDQSELVVIDHPAGTEVHTTDKLRPRGPFPRGELWTLENRVPLQRANRLDGAVVTDRLQAVDRRMVSPATLRVPQLRGLAEPSGVILDFGTLPVERPLVLALTGWLRFGGGMANVSASHDPDLPFPFPRLEVEAPGGWRPVEVEVGAPSGKTKTILVDLAGRLPEGSGRLRLTTAFEVHWDRIALFERRLVGDTTVTRLRPDHTDLHWRGFSEYAGLPWDQPLTPDYRAVYQNAPWPITPVGWCTRYGPVDELIAAEDNALALLNGGDELTLRFAAARLSPPVAGRERSFFLYNVGWDKDADFHVELGWQVGPLPWHGMEDRRYGSEPRPALPSDELMARYNTRWVGQHTLQRAAR
ncbi:MAG: VCBS repeat-containing protein [Verrucomicrobiales bacterium]|nr:VCBS repeat-containing protein [Verrucomicrobiales bacterium]